MVAKKKTAKKKVNTAARKTPGTVKTEKPTVGASRAGRPKRARPIGDFRDVLRLENLDPNYHYRWVLSAADMDKRIFDALQAGWVFVDATIEDKIIDGEYSVGQTQRFGSVYRVPAARRMKDEYLYLMKMELDMWEDLQDWKQEQIDEREADIFRTRTPEEDAEKGQYSIRHEIGYEERVRKVR